MTCSKQWGEVTQSCPTLCDPMDCSPPGSLVHGIFQAWILEWVAISFSRGIFPTQGSDRGLPHSRQTLYRLSYQGKTEYRKNKMQFYSSSILLSVNAVSLGWLSLCYKGRVIGVQEIAKRYQSTMVSFLISGDWKTMEKGITFSLCDSLLFNATWTRHLK